MTRQPAPRSSLRFGEFEFAPGLRRLTRSGVVVEVSSRAIDILAALTDRPGEVIAKRELLARVWPDVVVAEAACASSRGRIAPSTGRRGRGRQVHHDRTGPGVPFPW